MISLVIITRFNNKVNVLTDVYTDTFSQPISSDDLQEVRNTWIRKYPSYWTTFELAYLSSSAVIVSRPFQVLR